MRLKSHKLGPSPNHLHPPPRAVASTTVNRMIRNRLIKARIWPSTCLFGRTTRRKSQEGTCRNGTEGAVAWPKAAIRTPMHLEQQPVQHSWFALRVKSRSEKLV